MTDCKNLDLARQWAADIDADRETLSQDTIDAAADLISSLPDSWVGADTLRKYIADWREGLATAPRGNYEDEMLDDLEALLPAPPAPRTMAEIEWSDEEHHLAEALFGDTRKVVMLARDTNEEGDWSEWIHCRMEDGSTDLIEKEYLTPTGRKYRLEPEDDVAYATGGALTTQDVVDECRAVRKERAAPEPASPRPEDVPVGEPWQVEIEGRAAIGYRNDPESRLCWAVVSRDDGTGHHWMYDSDVTLIARLVPETTEQNDAKQDDEQEFDPAYIYRDKDGETWEYLDGKWVQGDSRTDRLVSLNVNHGLNNLLPKYGPYTRIEQDDVPEFDPAYTYRDPLGNEWSYVIHGWRCYSTATGKLLASHPYPPAKFGPYTRIEDTNE